MAVTNLCLCLLFAYVSAQSWNTNPNSNYPNNNQYGAGQYGQSTDRYNQQGQYGQVGQGGGSYGVAGGYNSLSGSGNSLAPFQPVYEWFKLDYNWLDEMTKSQALSNRRFIPENNALASIKAWRDRLFVTIPRWKEGVPVTLASLPAQPYQPNASPRLDPFPNWQMQEIGNCSALQSVQGIEVDTEGKIWILDSGRTNILEAGTGQPSRCPPKLVIIDLNSVQFNQGGMYNQGGYQQGYNPNQPYNTNNLQPGQTGYNPNQQYNPNLQPGQPGYNSNLQPGQPGYNPSYNSNLQPGQPGYNPNLQPGQPGYNPNQPYNSNLQPGQPGYNPNYNNNLQPGQPGYNPNYNSNLQPGQPGYNANLQPGQPGYNPNNPYNSNLQPGQPGYNPNYNSNLQPGQPGYNPNLQPGQPGYNPNLQPGQPGYNPNQQYNQNYPNNINNQYPGQTGYNQYNQYNNTPRYDQFGNPLPQQYGGFNQFGGGLNNFRIVKSYPFPTTVATPFSNKLSDIVLDNANGWYAYITDSGDDPGIIVYSFREDRSWKVKDARSMRSDPDVGFMSINNIDVELRGKNIDGIALSPAAGYERTLYFSPLGSNNLYSVPTSVLKNPNLNSDISSSVVDLGRKQSLTDGMITDNRGNLYFGLLGINAIGVWNTNHGRFTDAQRIISRDNRALQWPSSFSIDDAGNLWVVTNRLQNYLTGRVNPNEPNYRILKAPLGGRSYQYPADLSGAGANNQFGRNNQVGGQSPYDSYGSSYYYGWNTASTSALSVFTLISAVLALRILNR